VVLRQTSRAVTPIRGLSGFSEFLRQIGFCEPLRRDLPLHLKSPKALPADETFTAFLISVVGGARRSAHPAVAARADRALYALLGGKRFPSDGTIRNLFMRFTQEMVGWMYEPLWAWQLARLPERSNFAGIQQSPGWN
jgi:hypothetical protein